MAEAARGAQRLPDVVQQPGPGGNMPGRMGMRRIEAARNPRRTLRRLMAYLAAYRWALAGAALLVVVATACELAAPFLTAQAIDGAIARGDGSGLLRLALALVALYATTWLAQAAQGIIMARVAQRAMRDLRRQLFDHVQTLPLAYYDRHPHGDLMSRLTNDMTALTQVLSQNVAQLVGGLLSLAGVLVMVFALNFWLAWASMIVFPIMMGLVGSVGRRTRRQYRDLQRDMGLMTGQLEEMYSGQRVILSFGRQAAALGEFEEHNQRVAAGGIRAQSYALLVPPMMGILTNANVAIVAGVGGWMVLQGWATVGTIAAFIAYSRQFAGPLRQLGDLYNQIQAALAGAERILEIIDEPSEPADHPNAQPIAQVRGHVQFDHVSFAYQPGVPVIRDMSLTALPGQTVALVGPTGAGKTTITNLLARFYDVDSGAIRIDGQDIRDVPRDDLRGRLGIVLQDTFLFTGPVMDTIRYGRLDATDEEVVAAARLANADAFIRRLPRGYQTELSERGGNLSQGQRQLLSIARAVLANPSILVLDEATSSVDTRTELHIQEALLRLMAGRTSLVIAHRLSTIREADLVVVIRDGQVVEQGTHDDLLAKGGFYHQLYNSQFKGQVI